jgi:spore coat protein SA
MTETILVSALGGSESSRFLGDFQNVLRAANVEVAVVRVRTSKRARGSSMAPSHGVFLIPSPSIRWRAFLLGYVERLLIALKTLGAPVLRAGRGRILGGLSRRLQPEARLAALRARRLDAAASEEVEALFDVLDPALVVSLHPCKGRELPLLAAAYRRRTPVVAVIRGKGELGSMSMPAARFARLLVHDEDLAKLALRRGAHPLEVEVLDRSGGPASEGAAVADVVLDQLGLIRTRAVSRSGARVAGVRKRPRILMVGNELLPIPPSRGGAVELYVHEVSRRLVDEFEVVTCSPGPILDTNDGVGRRELSAGDDYLADVVRVLERETFDIVHVFNRPGFVLPIAAASRGASVNLSLHNDHLKHVAREDGVLILSTTDAVITDGDFLRQRAIDRFPIAAGKVASIHSGVDVDEFHPRLRESSEANGLRARYGIGEGPLLVYLGRLVAEKGAHLLPEILESVRRRYADAQLMVVGSVWFGETTTDEYVRRVEREARSLAAAINFTGFVPYDRIPSVLAAADVLVAPGQWEEPFGRFTIEALASGVPLVTSPLGGTTEAAVHERTALVVSDYRRPEAHADAVCRILADSALCDRITRAGRRLVERRFTWDRTARDFRRLYRKALSASDPAR